MKNQWHDPRGKPRPPIRQQATLNLQRKIKVLFLFFLLAFQVLQSQVVADFSLPDTVCVGGMISITNLTTGGSTWYWNFCSGNAASAPLSSVMNNTSGYLAGPSYITLAREGQKCYSFVTNQATKSITRFYHGFSFSKDPSPFSISNLTYNMISDSIEGIQIKIDNGHWYGYAVDNTRLIKLDFTNSLSNYPVFSTFFPGPTVNGLHGLAIYHMDNQDWVGFASSYLGNKIYRMDFGNSLGNTPAFTDISAGAVFSNPGPLSLVSDATGYYCYVVNLATSKVFRGTFGASYTNIPTWLDLGIQCGSDAMGIMLTHDCRHAEGLMSRYETTGDLLFRLLLPQGLSGLASTTAIPNTGSLSLPRQFAEITRFRDTLYTFICNYSANTITRLNFITCTNSSIPSSVQLNPPPYNYNAPGLYNVSLSVNEGLPDEQVVCKDIVVVDKPTVNLGPDRGICTDSSLVLDAGANCDMIQWSTGETTRTITVTQSGKFWVTISKFGCLGSDTVNIRVFPPNQTNLQPDTAICFGVKYILNPGPGYRSLVWNTGDTTGTITVDKSGRYWVHTTDTNNCNGADTVTITVKPEIAVHLVRDTAICSKASITLNASVSGATYLWQDGSRDSILTVTDPGVYWVRVSTDSCSVQDTSLVRDCSTTIYFPQAFTPNGDGLNDYFRPIGPSLSNFSLTVFDRWGQQVFTTNSKETGWDGSFKGSLCPVGTYSYIATYELYYEPGTTGTVHGTVTLVR